MKNRLARSLRVSSMEPDTSITQNITAWLLGTGTGVRARKRRSMGSRYGILSMRAVSASMRRCSSATASLAPSSCARAARLPLRVLANVGAQQVRQRQVFKKELHELFLGQREGEVVLALPTVAGLRAAPARSALGPFDAVAAHMLCVAGVHRVSDAALAMVEHGLADVLARYGDALGLLHVAH